MADEKQPEQKQIAPKTEPKVATQASLDALAGRLKSLEGTVAEFIEEVRHKLAH